LAASSAAVAETSAFSYIFSAAESIGISWGETIVYFVLLNPTFGKNEAEAEIIDFGSVEIAADCFAFDNIFRLAEWYDFGNVYS
jgi:hypothetical protein